MRKTTSLKSSAVIKDNIRLAKDKIQLNKAPLSLDKFSKEMEDIYYKNLSKSIALK